ncbi:MAG: hypothetical protein AAF526_10825 [Pseudomonadota bacterium]
MITLVFVTCLIGSPVDCKEHALPVYEPMSPMACLLGAQAELARWRDVHPDRRIVEWRCTSDRLAQARQ